MTVRSYPEAEHQTRVDLAACYRLVALYGMTDMIYNHITARLPGAEDVFLINRYGLHYTEITASNLLKVDLQGNIIDKPADCAYGISRAGYVIHSAIHAARPDVQCVIHTHTRAGLAVSAMADGLMPLNQTALRFYKRIGYHDFEGPALDEAEKARLVDDLGAFNSMILRNHGLIACGPTVGEAFNLMYWLESACKAQVDALAGGRALVLPPEAVCDRTARLYDPEVRRFGPVEWDAMLRLLDRQDASFRD